MSSLSEYLHARGSAPKLLLFVIVPLLLNVYIVGCVTEDDLTADQREYQLSQQLMCPVCDGQTLDQSQAQLSEDMKVVIRQKIEQGETNSEIRAYFVQRYGEIVLASPEVSGFNLIAWVVPGFIFLGGALLVGNAYLNMRRRNRNPDDAKVVEPIEVRPAASDSTEDDLDEYLQRADREIEMALGSGTSESTPDSDDRNRT